MELAAFASAFFLFGSSGVTDILFSTVLRLTTSLTKVIRNIIHSFSILSDDRSKASSKTILPHSVI